MDDIRVIDENITNVEVLLEKLSMLHARFRTAAVIDEGLISKARSDMSTHGTELNKLNGQFC
jgi:hypothetical protein